MGAQQVTADFNQDGKLDLVCSDGTVLLGNGDGTFRTGTPLNLNGTKPSLIATADFNGDGKPDVLLTGSSTFFLYVFLGNGDGTFEPAVGTNVGATLSAISTADVNGDGKTDVLAIGNNTLFDFPGHGDGTFASGVAISTGTLNPSSVLTDDFNGDGKVDIAVTGSNSLGILLGNGNGTFQAPVVTTLPSTVAGVVQVVPGDLNNDGKLDLVIYSSTNSVHHLTLIFLGNGDGTFQSPIDLQIPAGFLGDLFPSQLAVADLNNDGKLDLVAAALAVGFSSPPFLQVLLGNGDGTFTAGDEYFDYETGGALSIGDFNGDGKPDLASLGTMLLGNGNGTFKGNRAASDNTFAGHGYNGVTGDFNNDGIPDIAYNWGDLDIFLGDGLGGLSFAHTYSSPPGFNYYSGMVTADLNGDRNLDLMIASQGNLSVLLGRGDGSFGAPTVFSEGVLINSGVPFPMASGDFNGDHKPDLAALASDELIVFLGNGDGTFGAPASYFAGSGASSLVVGDFNNDGNEDAAIGSSAGIAILLGNGDGTFQAAKFYQSLGHAVDAAADLNGDGNLDLIGNGIVMLGKGDGTFSPPIPVHANYNYVGGVVDLNGDGKLDLVTAGTGLSVQVSLGNGDGTFQSPISAISLGRGSSIFTFVGDFNRDGKPDIALNVDNGVVTLLNVTRTGFTMAASTLSPTTVMAGGSATSNVTLVSTWGFKNSVTLSCSITLNGSAATTAPPTCSFNPTSLSNGAGTSTLTVSTTANSASLTPPARRPSALFYALWLPLGGVALIGAGVPSRSRRRKLLDMLSVCLILTGLVFLAACGGSGSSGGGGGGGSGTPAGTYTITVKGTAGSISNTATVTLTVQ
jgi:hypothetical protein